MVTGDPDPHGVLRRAIRDVPDFPKPGIVFKDVTPLLADAGLFGRAVRAMGDPFRGDSVTHVVAVESRGFLFGAPIALALGAGLVPVRKPGKLPYETRRAEYMLEYGSDALEVHGDAFDHRARVLVVDDVLATGGTAGATARLIEMLGGTVVGFSFLIELGFLIGRSRLGTARIASVLAF
jgi:adenine phosphoribosyltransferase